MPSIRTLFTGGLLVSAASAATYAGFNSGSTKADNSVKQLADFQAEFETASKLVGTPTSFNSVRLYTMVQGGTTADPISAFQAAMNTNTKLLLGIWCSQTTTIQNDLTALSTAIKQYGTKFTDLVIGISVGSEDLYRNSATGVANKAGVGADPSVVAGFISQVRSAVKGTTLANVPIGHVDTWDVWGNSSNKAVLDAIDFLGVDAYPYFESNRGNNSIENAVALWDEAYQAAMAAANGKPVWITETGWPASGPDWGQGVPSVANAKQYWDEIGCTLFGKTNTFWYTLRDSNPVDKAQFAITDDLSTTPKFNLTCPPVKAAISTTSSAASPSATSSSGSGSGGSSSGSSGSPGSSGSSGTSGTSGSSGSSDTSGSPGSTTTSSAAATNSSGAAAGTVAPQSLLTAALFAVAAMFTL